MGLPTDRSRICWVADTYKYCSPTRGSFLSGRLPYKLDATRCNIIPWTLLDGLDLKYELIPQKLKAAGYRTHHVGKWRKQCDVPLSANFAPADSLSIPVSVPVFVTVSC